GPSHTVAVLPIPTASVSGNSPICAQDSATLTFTGTPGAVVTYTVNGEEQTVTLDAAGNATVTGTYTDTTAIVLVSVANGACVTPLNQSVVITVIPLPTASISGEQIICSGQSATGMTIT